MAVAIYNTGTEYVANAITMTRGTIANITSVGVYHNTDPTVIPTVNDFTIVTLVDGTVIPTPELAEVGFVDILSLIGPGGDAVLTPGDYQRWTLVTTATENIIRKVDTITIM